VVSIRMLDPILLMFSALLTVHDLHQWVSSPR
jgi:hypothetical protein